MSSENSTKETQSTFISRLEELFNTNEPSQLQRKLGVTYQSAKNYLTGRKPNAEVLEKIVEVTDVSLNWLLMGQGPKYLRDEFSLERTIELHDDWYDVMREWYEFEGREMPEDLGAGFMKGWSGLSPAEKADAIRDLKRLVDRAVDREGGQ